MSHDPEAEGVMAKTLHEVACPCGGWPCQWVFDPDDPTDEAAEVSMARYRRDAPRMLDHLAAAGYTVTRDRYEPARTGTLSWWWSDSAIPTSGGAVALLDGERERSGRDLEPLYRKIEGSTDGGDRD